MEKSCQSAFVLIDIFNTIKSHHFVQLTVIKLHTYHEINTPFILINTCWLTLSFSLYMHLYMLMTSSMCDVKYVEAI